MGDPVASVASWMLICFSCGDCCGYDALCKNTVVIMREAMFVDCMAVVVQSHGGHRAIAWRSSCNRMAVVKALSNLVCCIMKYNLSHHVIRLVAS